jgi:hypothetical protein
MTAMTLDCRLLAASAAAYGIVAPGGTFTKQQPYYDAVGYKSEPVVIAGGPEGIDAALVGCNDDGVILAFRGTLPPGKNLPSLLDWIQDVFLAEPTTSIEFPGKIHAGFHMALSSIWLAVLAAVKDQNRGGTVPLYITGHSKGAGMIPLAAWRLRHEGINIKGVVSFAPPHPGDTEFAQHYNATIQETRYENHLDLVPFLPPTQTVLNALEKIPLLGEVLKIANGWDYAPVGTLRYIQANGEVIGSVPGLEALRLAEIAEKFLTGQDREVIDAHTLDCGHGYNQGICGKAICGS